MGKSSRNSGSGELRLDRYVEPETQRLTEVKVDSESKTLYNKATNKVKLQSLLGARLEYRGQVSGKLYVWNSAGDIIEVDTEDSAILLAKRVGGHLCCGNSRDANMIFQIAN